MDGCVSKSPVSWQLYKDNISISPIEVGLYCFVKHRCQKVQKDLLKMNAWRWSPDSYVVSVYLSIFSCIYTHMVNVIESLVKNH